MGSQDFCSEDIEGHGQGTALSEPPVQVDKGSELAIDFNRACDRVVKGFNPLGEDWVKAKTVECLEEKGV